MSDTPTTGLPDDQGVVNVAGEIIVYDTSHAEIIYHRLGETPLSEAEITQDMRDAVYADRLKRGLIDE